MSKDYTVIDNEQRWDELSTVWQSVDGETEKVTATRLSHYLEVIRKKERKDLFELIIDIVVGGLLCWFGVEIAIEFLTLFPLWPNEEETNQLTEGINNTPMPTIEIIGLYSFYLIFSLGPILLGIWTALFSYRARQNSWKKAVLNSASPASWFTEYYQHKIKLCKIGKTVSLAIGTMFLLSFLLLFSTGSRIDFSNYYESFLRFGLFVLFPLSIYLVAVWQEKRFQAKRDELIGR